MLLYETDAQKRRSSQALRRRCIMTLLQQEVVIDPDIETDDDLLVGMIGKPSRRNPMVEIITLGKCIDYQDEWCVSAWDRPRGAYWFRRNTNLTVFMMMYGGTLSVNVPKRVRHWMEKID